MKPGILVRTSALALLAGLVGCGGEDSNPAGPDPPSESPPEILDFHAGSSEINHGSSVTLSWEIEGAASAMLAPDNVSVNAARGSISRRPFEPTTYTLIASNEHGTDEETLTIDVRYAGGIYVNSVDGDDALSGLDPPAAVKTLERAMELVPGVGVIFLSAGEYPFSILIDGFQAQIYGGLNPETFFEEPQGIGFDTVLRPASGTPVTIRNSFEAVSLSNLILVAPASGEVALDILDAGFSSRRVTVVGCTLNGRAASLGIGARVRGTSAATISRCRIFGGKTPFNPGAVLPETRGLSIEDDASVRVSHSFIDGGRATNRSSGIDVNTTGTVGIGLNTISAEIRSAGGSNSSAAIRIRRGFPAIGGNILFTQGVEPRLGVREEGLSEESNAATLEWNLFIDVGAIPYRNSNGTEAVTEGDLNDPNSTTQDPGGFVFGNRLVVASINTVLEDFNGIGVEIGDYRLKSPPSVAIDGIGDGSVRECRYGTVTSTCGAGAGDLIFIDWVDIEGQSRPSTVSQTDFGADEWRE